MENDFMQFIESEMVLDISKDFRQEIIDKICETFLDKYPDKDIYYCLMLMMSSIFSGNFYELSDEAFEKHFQKTLDLMMKTAKADKKYYENLDEKEI
jgi:hypothetical protein